MMSSSSSLSSSLSPLWTHTSEKFWREYIGGNSLQLFEVIHRSIDLAKIDYPEKFLVERGRIAQSLFTPTPSPSPSPSHPPLNNNNNNKTDDNYEEVEEKDGNKSEVDAVSKKDTEEEESEAEEGEIRSPSGQRPPRHIIRIRCKVRTEANKQENPSLLGNQETPPSNDKQKPMLGKQETPPAAAAQQQTIIKVRTDSMRGMQEIPPRPRPSLLAKSPMLGKQQETPPVASTRTPQEPMKKKAVAAAAPAPQQPCSRRPPLPIKPAAAAAATRPRPPLAKSGNKVDYYDNDMEKRFQGTKRKLREAYDRADFTKRIRTTQTLDFSESAKLQKNDYKLPMGRNNTTSTYWGGRRSSRR